MRGSPALLTKQRAGVLKHQVTKVPSLMSVSTIIELSSNAHKLAKSKYYELIYQKIESKSDVQRYCCFFNSQNQIQGIF